MIKSIFRSFVSFILIFLIVIGSVVWWGKAKYEEPQNFEIIRTFIIKPGESFDIISQNLSAQNLINNLYVLKFGIIFTQNQKKLKFGEYEIPKNASMRDIVNLIVSGETKFHKLVIPEGFSTWQVIERIKSEELLSGDVIILPLEGSLAPQTYLFSRGDDREALLSKMKNKQMSILDYAWDNRVEGLPFENKFEVLKLASIIEEEASLADERKIIASVFINRLKKKMKLQTDPSVIYGITRGEYNLGRGLYLSELRNLTPWNTYKIKGLPLTPISNPGEASIYAATNPALTDFLYFVANGSGGHWFAKSYQKHTENVKRWREIEERRKNESSD